MVHCFGSKPQRRYMEEEFEEFEEHPQDVMEQYQDYPYDYDY